MQDREDLLLLDGLTDSVGLLAALKSTARVSPVVLTNCREHMFVAQTTRNLMIMSAC